MTQRDTIDKAFDIEGARIYGGRWNQKRTPVVFAASSAALCALEMLDPVDSDLLPILYLFKIDIPDEVVIGNLHVNLPINWRDTPAPEVLQD